MTQISHCLPFEGEFKKGMPKLGRQQTPKPVEGILTCTMSTKSDFLGHCLVFLYKSLKCQIVPLDEHMLLLKYWSTTATTAVLENLDLVLAQDFNSLLKKVYLHCSLLYDLFSMGLSGCSHCCIVYRQAEYNLTNIIWQNGPSSSPSR